MGLIALVGLAAFGTLGGDQLLAAVAFVGLAIATVLAWVELGQMRRHSRGAPLAMPPTQQATAEQLGRSRSGDDRWASIGSICTTAIVAAGAVQTWYTPGTALAGGDLAPPNGTAWLGKLFSPWVWSGSDLGRPGNLETQLPWAAVLWLVHSAGGSSMVAQRLWFTTLFTGAALGALWLLRLLRASWVAATVGSLLYLFNPFVLSDVGTNPVLLAALMLVVIVPAIVVSVCSGRWRARSGTLALVASAPLIGYAYQNPPLLLAVAAAGVVAAVMSVIWLGAPALRRAARLLVLAVPLAAAASLYWLVPSIEQVHFDATQQLSALSSWTWTESRSTLANAFWLNTSWAWPFKYYVPYSSHYSAFPLSLLRYALPLIGFAALGFRYERSSRSLRQLTLVASGASASLLVIFFSTGTRLPGSLVFDPLYRLPYGWLLREPGRFLLLAGVGYTVMAGVTVDTWIGHLDSALGLLRRWSNRRRAAIRIVVGMVIAAVAALAPGYPLAFGAVAPGPRPDALPSTHVRVPRYWTDLANYLNGPKSAPGNLLVLPPDPFYQVRYTWGYYGNDSFITDMIERNVVDPVGQGYGAAGPALIAGVDQVASTLLAGDSLDTNRILRALGTPDVLVRGDISPYGSVASVDSPQALDIALGSDPAMELVRRFGPLSLYRLRASTAMMGDVRSDVPYATTLSRTPNLLDLSALPEGTAIITHRPIPAVPALVQVPSIAMWKLQGGDLRTVLQLPPGRSYALYEVGAQHQAPMATNLPVGTTTTAGMLHISVQSAPTHVTASLSMPAGVNEIADGSFTSGGWGAVGNCDAVPGTHPQLAARLGSAPRGEFGKALILSADVDIACVAKDLQWHGGPVLLTLTARRITGNAPTICVWEEGPNRCAELPALSPSHRWQTYQQIITPPDGTRGLSLFLYAAAGPGRTKTVDAFAAISVHRLPAVPVAVIVASPTRGDHRPPVLTTASSTYSPAWVVNGAAEHVAVNGMANGWLSSGDRSLIPHDEAASMIVDGFIATLVAVVMTMLLAGRVAVGTRRSGGAGQARDSQ